MKFHKSLIMFIMAAFTLLLACKKDDELKPQPTGKVIAHAGTDQTIMAGSTVTLDGSSSQDSKGKQLSYQWTFVSKPEGSTSILTNATQVKATFVPDLAGRYEAELTVSSTSGQAKDKIVITVLSNSTAQLLGGEITTDRVLENIVADPTKPDYRVTEDILLKARLTVNPGVIIEFEQDRGLTVLTQGTLIAKGNAAQKVIFTGRNKTKAFWKGIVIYSNNSLNELDQVTVEHAGSTQIAYIPVDLKANIALIATASSSAGLKVSNTVISNGGGFGLYVHGNSELTGFANNSFQTNTGAALFVPANQVHKLDAGSSFNAGNGYNGVQTRGILQAQTEVTWPTFTDGSSYYADSDLDIESGLRLAEGAKIEFNPGVALRIKGAGYLQAIGTMAKPVVFTAYTKNQNGYWGGMLVESSSDLNRLDYAEVSYAGNKEMPQFGDVRANIAVATTGKLTVEHTAIKHGLGWGIVAFKDLGARINENVATANTFEQVAKGTVKLRSVEETTSLAGEWVDAWTFTSGNHYSIDENFYNQATGTWFRGGQDPWSMNPQSGFGLKIDENGNYLWLIAEYGPWAGCGNPYSAEYIKGKVTAEANQLNFQHTYWRSKFYNPCDETQSVDTGIEPFTQSLRYEIYQETNSVGKTYWVLKFTNPDSTVFKYYKEIVHN